MIKKILVSTFALVLSAALSASAAKMITYRGKITSNTDGKLGVAVSDGSTGSWSVDPKAKITEGRKSFPLGEVHVGDEISVSVSEDGVIHRLNVMRAPAKKPAAKTAKKYSPGYWATQKGKGKWWTGEVIQLDPMKRDFQLKKLGGSETVHFAADAKTLTYVQPGSGKKRKDAFAAMRMGATVDAYALDGRTTQIVVHE